MSAQVGGLPTCARCGTRVSGKVVSKRGRSNGARTDFHPACWAIIEQSSADKADRAEEARRFATKRVEHLAASVPSWAWYLAGSEVSAVVRSESLRRFLAKWKPGFGSALLLGQSGTGKTTVVARIVRRLRDEAVESCVRTGRCETPELALAARTFWTTGAALIVARREHALGVGEPLSIARAKAASLLVIDELGHESAAPDPIFLEVIDARYALGAPSIVTSGLTRVEFVARYGDALFRRLTERGSLIEDHV